MPDTPLRIALTPGEPAGIGPELCIALAQQPQAVELVAVADPALLQERAALAGLPLTLRPLDTGKAPRATAAGYRTRLTVLSGHFFTASRPLAGCRFFLGPFVIFK